jgi:signal transduction histidine kinase
MASISVKDTGIGLPPEEARMVFSRFWRAGSARDRESGGLGIGLTVVKEIVDRHDGWVQVEGRKGEGACFTIHIPLYNEREQRKKDAKKDSKKGKNHQ